MRSHKRLVLGVFSILMLGACYLVHSYQVEETLSFVAGNAIASDYEDIAENTIILEVKDGARVYYAEPFQYELDDHDIYCFFIPSFAMKDDAIVRMNSNTNARIDKADGSSVPVHNGDSYDVFPLDELFRLVFCDSAGNDVIGCDVRLFQSELPAIFVDTESGSFEYVDDNKNHREAGSVTIFDADGSLIYKDDFTHITGRGNQTWGYEKKSYSLKLKNKKNLFGMGKAKDWILLSNVTDDSYLRNKITYDMAIAAGVPYSPESEYVDVYFNGAYHGMYMLSEKIEADSQRVPIANLDDENHSANKLPRKTVPQTAVDNNRKYADYSKSPVDVSGGYIVERDSREKYAESSSGFVSGFSGDCYALKSPEYATLDEIEYIEELFENTEKAVFAKNGVNPDTGKHYSEYLDSESFADKFIIEEITMNNGGGATSAYYYKPIDAISELLFAGPVWDYDKGYGNGYDRLDDNNQVLYCQTTYVENTWLYWALYQHDEFREQVKARYCDFYSEYLQELIDYRIDEYAESIGVSADMDRARWTHIYPDKWEHFHGEDYHEGVSYLKHWIIDRKSFLDELWIENTPVCEIRMGDCTDSGSILADNSDSLYLCRGKGSGYCVYAKSDELFDTFPIFNMTVDYFLRDIDTNEVYDYEGPGIIITHDVRLKFEQYNTDVDIR